MVTRDRFAAAARPRAATASAKRAAAPDRPSVAPWTKLQKAWRAIGKRVPELRDDLTCLATVQVDRARLAGSQIATALASRILVAVAFVAVFIVAASTMIAGVAGGIAVALQGNLWLANVITGIGTMVVLGGVISWRGWQENGRRLRQLEDRYQRRGSRPRDGKGDDAPARADGK
jgi:hypothetical protein